MRNTFGIFRYAFRQFHLAPIFTVTAVVTLAVGIGGTCAIFTLIHAVMLRSLPVSDPDQLFRVGSGDNCCIQGGPQDEWGFFSFPLYERLKAESPEFEQVTAFQAGRSRFSVRREGTDIASRSLGAEYVTGTFFSTLGVGPFAGRMLTPEDDKPSAAPAIVLSHRVWQTDFARDPSIVGSTFIVETQPFTVIGIAPPGFFGDTLESDPPDIWVPLQQEPLINADNGRFLHQPVSAWLRMIGRLRPGATTNGMAPRLTGVLREWMQHDSGYPANWMPDVTRVLPKQTIAVVPAGAGIAMMKEEYGRSLQILLAVCGLVLLIACANVSNLELVRAAGRRGQTAIRLAIGATRRQIVTEALAESVLLAIAGGAAGILVSFAVAKLLLNLAFKDVHFLPISAVPALPTIAFAFALSLVTGVVFGVTPAWFATRTDPAEALRGMGRGVTDRASLARRALLILQATLSVALVAGSMMLARSLNKLESQNFGYSISGRVVVGLHNPTADYTFPKLNALYRELEGKLNQLPGVQGSGLALYNPLTDNWGELILVSGHPAPQMVDDPGASWDRVSTNYLQNFGVQLVRGRYFSEADNEHTEAVAIVNEAFVKKFFKEGEDPIDQHFGLDLPAYQNTFRIIGIVHDAKFAGFGLRRPARPMFYAALNQSVDYKDDMMKALDLNSHFIRGVMLVTAEPAGNLLPALTRTLAELNPNLTITTVRTMQEQVELTFEQERAVAGLAGLFGVVALALAAIGLYGVTAYSIAQRTNEIGIRMALGADRGNVVRLILGGAFQRVSLGLILGLPLAVGAGRLISAQLYGVSPWDPFALVAAAAALVVFSFLAAMIPATRAARISPMRALRAE